MLIRPPAEAASHPFSAKRFPTSECPYHLWMMQHGHRNIRENEKTLSATKEEILVENSKLKEEVEKFELEKKELVKNTRLQNLESKLKTQESSTKSESENFEKVIEGLKSQLQESENCYNELKLNSDNFKEKSDVTEKKLRDELEKTKSELKAAEKLSEENESKAKLADKEATSRVREMMQLAEILKKESESVVAEKSKENVEIRKELDQVKETLLQTQQAQDVLLTIKSKLEENIQKKSEELLSLTEKFSKQTEEFNQLKSAIKNLTQSPRKPEDTESLRTPSPSQYLPLFQNSTGSSSSSNELRLRLPLKNRHSILKQNSNQGERQTSKAVTFLSPVYRAPDSDSSDGFAVDPRYDKTSIKTYTSPKSKKV
ncbi:hypothetical protein Avbf_02867 [Armadillidium vulgare]|nr:hypothetical protein Avbf_02867 [Armadillidium vulgare]